MCRQVSRLAPSASRKRGFAITSIVMLWHNTVEMVGRQICRKSRWLTAAALLCVCSAGAADNAQPCVSGVYPHLAMFNDEGECGTGAVVPWAGSLWVITYGPHCPAGSTDKLYRIRPDLTQEIFPGSVGGTPANRLIMGGRDNCKT